MAIRRKKRVTFRPAGRAAGVRLRSAKPLTSPGPNKAELRYWDQLQIAYLAGELCWFAYHPLRLRLGHRCFYTPDFGLTLPHEDGSQSLELHDVKATWSDGRPGVEEDAMVKIKLAAELYPMFLFYLAIEGPRGSFRHELVPPGPARWRPRG